MFVYQLKEEAWVTVDFSLLSVYSKSLESGFKPRTFLPGTNNDNRCPCPYLTFQKMHFTTQLPCLQPVDVMNPVWARAPRHGKGKKEQVPTIVFRESGVLVKTYSFSFIQDSRRSLDSAEEESPWWSWGSPEVLQQGQTCYGLLLWNTSRGLLLSNTCYRLLLWNTCRGLLFWNIWCGLLL